MSDESYPSHPSQYALGPIIGYGAFAVVYKAKVLAPGALYLQEVAIKLVDLDSMEGTTFDDIRKELQIMRLTSHPNIISYHVAFPVESKIWLVMPLVDGGSCQAIVKELKRLKIAPSGIRNAAIVAFMLKETAEALDHCHKNQTLHRDIKASNLLVSIKPTVRVYLSDFGVSASLRDSKQRQTFVGTPCWMSPETLAQQTGYSYPADVWSFGITAIEMAVGMAPYQNLHPLKVMKNVIDSEPPRLEDFFLDYATTIDAPNTPQSRLLELVNGTEPGPYDKDLAKLIADCLQKDPLKRPTFDQILTKYKPFFDKADGLQLLELLEALPPLDAREQPRVGSAKGKKGLSNGQDPLSGEWNFDLEEEEEIGGKAQEFPGIGEEEF